jgi:ATP phosphoribosyltransferase
VAVPKGRVTRAVADVFARAGIDASALLADDRRLVRESGDGKLSFALLKPDDVPTYVEYGACDIGVCGRDVLSERRYDLLCPLDLQLGKCRLVLAAPAGTSEVDAPRVATKYVQMATDYFDRRGIPAEIIFVQGSVELAPLTGLSDYIVDLVETGTTLAENGLVERETIAQISSVLVANRSQYKLRHAEVTQLVERLRSAVAAT